MFTDKRLASYLRKLSSANVFIEFVLRGLGPDQHGKLRNERCLCKVFARLGMLLKVFTNFRIVNDFLERKAQDGEPRLGAANSAWT